MYDSHIHSKNSHDSKQSLDEICTTAIAKGLKAVSICDHADGGLSIQQNTIANIKNCIEDVKEARKKYGSELKVLQGVEIAEYLYDKENSDIVLGLCNYDVILGSVHTVLVDEFQDSYSRIDFSEKTPEDRINFLIKTYFGRMKDMVAKTDFDVLTHINCPFRYINGKYGRNIDVLRFESDIREIFEMIIAKNIALEINTSGFSEDLQGLMPTPKLIEIYKNMGGKLLTLGSDAHASENIGKGFPQTKQMLMDMGFEGYCYYEKRTRNEIPFQN